MPGLARRPTDADVRRALQRHGPEGIVWLRGFRSLAADGRTRLVLPGHGFTAAHGFDLAGGTMWRAAAGAALYLMLVAVLSLGVTTVVRDSPAAIGIVLGLLYVFPVVTSLVSNPAIQRRVQQAGPMSAGLDGMTTTGLHALPLTPWQGLVVVAMWAAGALVLGGVTLRLHDA